MKNHKPSNGLARLAGNWTDEEHRQFEEAVAIFRELDEELWEAAKEPRETDHTGQR